MLIDAIGHNSLLSRIRCHLIITGIACLVTLFYGCGGSDPAAPEQPDPAFIQSVSALSVGPGDTLVITGRNFGATPASNRVVFNNSLGAATPFLTTAERLECIVPGNAATGPMWVEKDGTRSNAITMEVIRSVGDVWVIGSATTSYSFKLPSSTGTESYLIVPHSASQQAASFGYRVSPGDASQFPVAERTAAPHRESTEDRTCLSGRLSQWVAETLKHAYANGRSMPQRISQQSSLEDTMQFFVLNTITPSPVPDPNDFTRVTAVRKHAGRRCHIYSDINSPAGGFQEADYEYFAGLFDRLGGIYATDSTYFGPPTDIDGNGTVVILFSPVVNDLTPDGTAQTQGVYTGFFQAADLLPELFPPGISNGREIFYMFVPDPSGVYGNQFPVDQVKKLTAPTLAHEFEHMISIGYRIFHPNPSYIQVTWLEEGMAHMAEDLNGMNQSNEDRIGTYLLDPDGPGSVPMMGNATLRQRAAIYLFLRYVTDRLGPGILKQMVQSTKKGTGTVELVTGENFFVTFADWLATLYLSGTGITSDPKYRYTSIDLQDRATFPTPLLVMTRRVDQGSFSDIVAGAAGDFFVLEHPSPPGIELAVDNFTLTAALRLVVVRIQ